MADAIEVDELMKAVFAKLDKKFNENITNDVFLIIERDKDLKKRYDKLVEIDGDDGAINSQIGKRVKKHFGLTNENKDGRGQHSKNNLPSSYQKYINK